MVILYALLVLLLTMLVATKLYVILLYSYSHTRVHMESHTYQYFQDDIPANMCLQTFSIDN